MHQQYPTLYFPSNAHNIKKCRVIKRVILKCFNNSRFFYIVHITWKIKCWINLKNLHSCWFMLCNFEAYWIAAECLLVISRIWNYEAPDWLIFLILLFPLLVQGLLLSLCVLIWGMNPSFITILQNAASVGDGNNVLMCVYMFCVCVWSPFILVADDLNMPPPVQVPSPADEPINHHHSVGAQTHHHHHHHHHRPGKIADYDPLVEAPRNSPYSARQSATLIYTSDRGPGTEYWNRCVMSQNI